jgi:hypothetical protein
MASVEPPPEFAFSIGHGHRFRVGKLDQQGSAANEIGPDENARYTANQGQVRW